MQGKRKLNENLEKEMVDLFRKLEVNVPLMTLIKRMPSYTKFLKDQCTHKLICKPYERVHLGFNLPSLFKENKYEDPGSFIVACQLGQMSFGQALLDLGAAINVFCILL